MVVSYLILIKQLTNNKFAFFQKKYSCVPWSPNLVPFLSRSVAKTARSPEPRKRMQWRDWKEKFGKKRPAYNIIKNNLNKKLKTFYENNRIKLYNWKFFIENKLNPLIYALPKFWSRFSFSDTKIAKKVGSTVVAVRVVCVKFVQW